MNQCPATLMVAVNERLVCIKVSGRANFTVSINFKRVFHELSNLGYQRFAIDLSDCQIMDSTFLGVLSGIGLKFSGQEKPELSGAVELIRPNARIADLLESLGVAHLFRIVNEEGAAEAGDFSVVEGGNTENDKVEITRNCLEAHRLLMEVHPDNIGRFKEVTQFLEEDLQRLETKARDSHTM